MTVLHWVRRDLRVADNPALHAACECGEEVVPVYIHDPDADAEWAPGGASRWWLDRSLRALAEAYRGRDCELWIRSGDTVSVLQHLLESTGARRLFFNRAHEPAARELEQRVETLCASADIDCQGHEASLLFATDAIATQNGDPFRVFTPFWKRCLEADAPSTPLPAPREIATLPDPDPQRIDALGLEPRPRWWSEFDEVWSPGEDGAAARLERFLAEAVDDYRGDRDRPDHEGTSRLSPHLHFGEISARQIWHATHEASQGRGAETFLSEVGWREFSLHVLHHFPQSARADFAPRMRKFPWREGAEADADFRAWCEGRTGVALVDAGMRELWRTGWMHNRVRMVVASYLCKNLRIRWQRGAEWFWDTLVDADLANNTMGWQWSAGCGADAAPYFRVFNPDTQAEKFDPLGKYRDRWLSGHERPTEPGESLKATRAAALEAYKVSREED